MHISKYFLPALVLTSLALVMTVSLWYGARPASAAISDGPFYAMTNASSTNVLTTSKSIAATTTGLRFREIVNLSGAAIYCQYNDMPATFTTGFIVPASTTKQWFGETLYTGAIRCIAPATAAITINEVI